MAAVEEGAPISTIDYDLWVKLPDRQYVRLLTIVHGQGGTIIARTLYELADGTHVNAIFRPDGLRSFDTEFEHCRVGCLDGQRVCILPLSRVIASKRASNRDKDIMTLPILERTLRMKRRLERSARNCSRHRR
ncbi:MAG: hypothetical protein HY360_13045 [Verrucomicrobia bacterium]|nr:hypothetical protein [Verrucomicrobiota bacterium]